MDRRPAANDVETAAPRHVAIKVGACTQPDEHQLPPASCHLHCQLQQGNSRSWQYTGTRLLCPPMFLGEGHMPKTKRDHFKTSVQSALGGSAGREVVGYAVSERISRLLAAVVPLTGTVIAVHNTPKGPWYFFVFDVGNPSICRLWSVPDQP